MAPAPGKSLRRLHHVLLGARDRGIEEAGRARCENCRAGGGCAIYAHRPQVCRDFECEWLTDRALPATLRPTASARC